MSFGLFRLSIDPMCIFLDCGMKLQSPVRTDEASILQTSCREATVVIIDNPVIFQTMLYDS